MGCALPLRDFHRLGVFPAAIHPNATAKGRTTRLLGSSWKLKLRDPVSRPKARDRLSWDFCSLRHMPAKEVRFPRGLPSAAPSVLRVWSPSRRFAPSHAWRRPVSRCSVHRIRPTGPCSSRSAVPLAGPRLSCRFLRTGFARAAATPEVTPIRKGARQPSAS